MSDVPSEAPANTAVTADPAARGLPTTSEAYLAPDGSEIRPGPITAAGSVAHCILRPGSVSRAVRHRTVEEVWFFVSGTGQVWRRYGEQEEIVGVGAGDVIRIPVGTHFQFKNTGDVDLEFVIATMPPWPGAAEAELVANHWPMT